jgi:FkbM family methyltransferase
MNLLTKNSEIYKEIRLLRPAIGATIRGDVKPLLAYFRYLTLRNKVKDKDVGILILTFYFGGYNISDQLFSLLLNEKSLIFKSYDKCKFVITHPADFINIGLYYHEPETFKFIMKQIKNCKVFVDVGANIGGYAIRAAKHCKVYAIEPLPRNYKILKINEKLNNVKINSFNIAAGNKNEKVKLYYTQGNLGLSTIKYVQNYFVEVEMKPLDEIINEESIDLMKIDVEGAEDLVLEGARNCLKRTKMVIIERSESFRKVYRILKEEGFKLSKFLDNVLFTK